MDYKAKHHRFTQCCFIFFLFYTFFCYYFFEFYHSMLCWLGFRIDNLFWFAFYMLSAILEKHPHMVLVLSFTKKNIWFYCLQEIKNEGTKIEKNNIRHLKKIYGFNFGHLYFFLCLWSSIFSFQFDASMLCLLRFKVNNLFQIFFVISILKKSCY